MTRSLPTLFRTHSLLHSAPMLHPMCSYSLSLSLSLSMLLAAYRVAFRQGFHAVTAPKINFVTESGAKTSAGSKHKQGGVRGGVDSHKCGPETDHFQEVMIFES